MKKKILFLLIAMVLLFPWQAKAEESLYHSKNLEEVLTEEGIEHNLDGYKETEDQAIIYLFRGNGCGYCRSFLMFLNEIVPEYGKYFRVVSYEVWQDADNFPLLNGFSKTLEVEVGGVPFIVIGDQYFTGYADLYDDKIKKAIMEEYENKNKNNIIEEAIKNADSEGYINPSDGSLDEEVFNTSGDKKGVDTSSILWNFIFITIGISIILIVNYFQNKRAEEKLDYIMDQLEKQKKGKKED